MDAVRKKNEKRGTPEEQQASIACSDVLLEEREGFISRTREKLQSMRPECKHWWNESRALLQKKAKTSSIPALKKPDGSWLLDSDGKADHFAEVFASKCAMIDVVEGPYSEIQVSEVMQPMIDSPCPELAAKVLWALSVDSGTGPDLLPARILRACAVSLADPVARLLKRIIATGEWPASWKMHWICPIYKKKAVFNAKHYRGIHLTSQLSKVMERLLQQLYAPFLKQIVAFEPNQFAYCEGRGARDAVALLALTWLDGFGKNLKFAVYCSDVSGAFDKVRRERLEAKLRAKWIHASVVKVLVSWLGERKAQIVVVGKKSSEQKLQNMVYQGTVLGPGLWNIMYEDARKAIAAGGFTEIVYADDLNSWRSFRTDVDNGELLGAAKGCQRELHSWGTANQIEFDPDKESMHVVARHDAHGGAFTILGIEFDCKLVMHSAVSQTAASAFFCCFCLVLFVYKTR